MEYAEFVAFILSNAVPLFNIEISIASLLMLVIAFFSSLNLPVFFEPKAILSKSLRDKINESPSDFIFFL